ncbi:roadblock/LC7 domain-containing protein [bacterium]|nr:roadblock/LC7 domain-containing protein [bacterium]
MDLIIYREEQFQIDEILKNFLKNSGAKTVLLITPSGFTISKQGNIPGVNIESLAVLSAGTFASTREIARLIGEDEFTVLFHQGKRYNIHFSLVVKDVIFVAIFENTTTIGMVRLFAREAARALEKILLEVKRRRKIPISEGPVKPENIEREIFKEEKEDK